MAVLTNEELRVLALAAKRLRTAGGEREAHALRDLLALNDVIAETDTASYTQLPIRMSKVRFGGSICSN
jgi:hypothetical protein